MYIDTIKRSGGKPVFPAAKSLPVLQYACEHMGPTWKAGVLRAPADMLAHKISRARAGEEMDWQMAVYTVQSPLKLTGMTLRDLPAPVAEAVMVRRERAVALAGTFFKAGRLADTEAAHPWAPAWGSMARLPAELRERIAFMSHLVVPPGPLSAA